MTWSPIGRPCGPVKTGTEIAGVCNIVHIAWADNRDVPAAQCDLSDAAGPASNNIGNRNQNIYEATLDVGP